MRKAVVSIITTGVLLLGAGAATGASEAPIRHQEACATYVLSGRTPTGHEFDEPVTFCGPGIHPGSWVCPVKSPGVHPGEKMQCKRQ